MTSAKAAGVGGSFTAVVLHGLERAIRVRCLHLHKQPVW